MKIFSREKLTSSYTSNYFCNRQQNKTHRELTCWITRHRLKNTTFKGIKIKLNYFCMELKTIQRDMVDMKKNQLKILVTSKGGGGGCNFHIAREKKILK